MGQIEVYDWLKRQRQTGNHRFFTPQEVARGLRSEKLDNGQNIRSNLLSLEMFGYVETQMTGKLKDWRRLFRLKKKYVMR